MSDEIATLGLRIDTRSFEGGLQRATAGTETLGSTATKVAASIAAAFAGNKITDALKKAIGTASMFREDLAQFEHVMRNVTKRSEQWLETLTSSDYGRTSREAQVMLMNLTSLAKGMDMTDRAALELSGEISKLSIDIASFMAKNPEDVANAFQSALIGNTQSLRTYGVVLTDATIKQEIANQAAAGLAFTNERAARASAIVAMATKQQADAIGDFAVESGGFSNQIKAISGNLDELYAKFGKALLGPATTVVTAFNNILVSLREVDDTTASYIARGAVLAAGLGTIGTAVYAVRQALAIKNAIVAAGTNATRRDTIETAANTHTINAQTAAIAANTAARRAAAAVERIDTSGMSTAGRRRARRIMAERIYSERRAARALASSTTMGGSSIGYASGNAVAVGRFTQAMRGATAMFSRLNTALGPAVRLFARLPGWLKAIGILYGGLKLAPHAADATVAFKEYMGAKNFADAVYIGMTKAADKIWDSTKTAANATVEFVVKDFKNTAGEGLLGGWNMWNELWGNKTELSRGRGLDRKIQEGNERREAEAAAEQAKAGLLGEIRGLSQGVRDAFGGNRDYRDKLAADRRFDGLDDAGKLKELEASLAKVNSNLFNGTSENAALRELGMLDAQQIAKKKNVIDGKMSNEEYDKFSEHAEKRREFLITEAEKNRGWLEEQDRLMSLIAPLQKRVNEERAELSRNVGDFLHDINLGEAKTSEEKLAVLESRFQSFADSLASLGEAGKLDALKEMQNITDKMRQLEEIRLPPQQRTMQASQQAIQANSVQARELENRVFQKNFDRQIIEAKNANKKLDTIKDAAKNIAANTAKNNNPVIEIA